MNVRPDETGVSLWREVYERLTREIRGGSFEPGQRLPSDVELAKDYGVARQTMRRALSALRDQGILRIEQGRGTFVTDKPLDFRIGGTIFLDQNLRAANALGRRRILGIESRQASPDVAKKLGIDVGDTVTAVRVSGSANGQEIGVGENVFATSMLPDLPGICDKLFQTQQHLIFPELIEKFGRQGLHRATIRLGARPPTLLEEQALHIDRNEYVIETISLIVDSVKSPCYLSLMSYPSSRVCFHLDEEISLK